MIWFRSCSVPNTTRTFRVFVSSTFEDLKEERDALQREVWPKLRKLCEQHGARFQAIDLRWGVRDEAALDQKTMEICLREIERCQRTGIKPNFVVLLGQRYGWRPLPSRVEGGEFEALLEQIADGEGRALAKSWYQRDDNAVPPEYLLKPRAAEWVQSERWQALEARLHGLLFNAARTSGLSEEALVKYEASATHQEILKGLGVTPEDRRHVFAFCRSVSDTDSDLDLVNLKRVLHERLPAGNVLNYEPGDFAKLCREVERTLRVVIESQAAGFESRSALSLEIEAHEAFARERALVFGREDVLEGIVRYIQEDGPRPLVLHGPSGSGKSAVMAQASERARTALKSAVLIRRFIGVSPDSSSGVTLLRRLCEEIGDAYGMADDLPADFNGLVHKFRERLTHASAGRPLVIFLDALDQLAKDGSTLSLSWLGDKLPPHCRIVASTTDLAPTIDGCSFLDLEVFDSANAAMALDFWLGQARRRLVPEQREHLLAAFARCGLPLYLKLAFEEARAWASYQTIDESPLGEGVVGVIDTVLNRLSQDSNHGPVLVSRSLSYLATARYGLTEHEMLDVLSADKNVWGDFEIRAHHTPPEHHLPVIVWSRLYLDLEFHLTERATPYGAVYDFYHAQFRTAAMGRYLGTDTLNRLVHDSLAAYFQTRTDPDGLHEQYGDARAIAELPYHVYCGSNPVGSLALARDERFLSAQSNCCPDDPDLALHTVRYAFQAAWTNRDAPSIAEFVLAHFHRLVDPVVRELPSEALTRPGLSASQTLHRAWGLADGYNPEIRSYWHLLLAWKLQEMGRIEDAAATFRRFEDRPAYALGVYLEPLACLLLRWLEPVEGVNLAALGLGSEGLRMVVVKYITHRDFARAQAAAALAHTTEQRSKLLSSTLVAMAKEGLLTDALEIANTVESIRERAVTLSVVAVLPATPEDRRLNIFSKALQVASTIPDALERTFALINIADYQARSSFDLGPSAFRAALDAATEVANLYRRSEARAKISFSQASSGDINAALITANSVEDAAWRASALATVGEAFALQGLDSQTVFSDAHRAIEEQLPDRGRDHALASLAGAEARAGKVDQARQTLDTIVDPSERVRTLSMIAVALASVQQDSLATLAEALSAANQVEAGWERDRAHGILANAQLSVNEIDRAVETARLFTEPETRCSFLTACASALRQAGRDPLSVLRETHETLTRIQDNRRHAQAASALAALEAKMGLDPSLLLLPPTDNPPATPLGPGRDWVLSQIAIAQARAGNIGGARVTLQAIRDSWRDSAVSAIAKAEANAGRYADSLATTRMIENGPDRGSALKHLVDAMVEAGEYEVALTTALGIEDVEVRPMAVAIVAERYARLGRTSESVSAASALDGWGKDEVLRRVMRTQASVGDFERARISADLIQDDSRRIKALAELTVAVSRAGLDASGLLASGLREAGNVDSTFRLEALTDVVISAMQSGLASLAPLVSEVATAAKEAVVGSIGIFSRIASEQAAEEEYSHATNTALMIEDSFYREETLAKIAIAQAVAYDEEGAEETIVKIGSAARRAETWAELGLALARDRRDPQPAFDRATKLALIADPQGDSFGAVKKAVHALCEAGRYGQAIELCDMALGQPYVVLDVIESLDASRPEAEDAMPQILPRAVWSRDAAWTLCGKLVLFFPEQAETLAGKIATYDDR